MDVGPISRQKVTHVWAIAAEADLIFEAQRMSQVHKIPAEWSVTEDVQREGSSRPPGGCQHLKNEPMVLHGFKVANGHKITERFSGRPGRQWRDEVTDDSAGHLRRLRQPGHECIARPPRHVHEAVDLRDHRSLDLPDCTEHPAVALDLPHVDPFIGLRDPEVNGHHHALVRADARAQRRAS